MRTKTKFKVGDIVIIGHQAMPHNEYAGFTAKVEYCKRCCKDYRLQMLEWGNNVALKEFNQNKIFKIK